MHRSSKPRLNRARRLRQLRRSRFRFLGRSVAHAAWSDAEESLCTHSVRTGSRYHRTTAAMTSGSAPRMDLRNAHVARRSNA